MQCQSLWKTPWQLALKIQKTWQQRNWRWKNLEVSSSWLTGVPSKRIAVPWDTDHEASPAPANKFKRDDDRGHEDWNRSSDRGQDDSHQEKHSHKRSQSSRSSKGSAAGSGSLQSQSSAESRADRLARVGSSENQTTADEGPAGVGSTWSQTTVDRSPAGVGSSHNRTTAGEGPKWGVQLESLPLGTGLLQAIGLPPPARKVLLPWSPVKLKLALRAWLPPTVELERALRVWLPPTVREPFPLGSRRPLTSLWPRVLRPVLGIHLLWDLRSLWMPVHLEPIHCKTGLLRTDLRAVQGNGLFRLRSDAICSHSYGNWRSWHNWQGLISEPDAWYGWGQWYDRHGLSRHGAGGLHGNAHHRRHGVSQSTQLTDPSQLPIYPYSSLLLWTVALERVQTKAWKLYQFSLQCQLIMEIRRCPLFPYRLWRVCIIHPAWRCPLLAWVCSTDHQTWHLRWKPATCNSKWIQLPQLGPLDLQMLIPGPQFVQQPTATAGALSQQGQDAVTMASAMWSMMNTVLQQQHTQMPGWNGYT